MYLEPNLVDQQIRQRFALAETVIKAAGDKALNFFNQREQLVIETKADPQDVVSIADKEVEILIRQGISAHYPDDGFLGEEQGVTQGENDYLWVIDPIDGTACFVNGMPPWCISIALMKGDKIAAGLIYDPNADELFTAIAGEGTQLNGSQITALEVTSVTEGVMGVGTSHRVPQQGFIGFMQRLLESGGMFVRNGSGALMLAYVAAGRLIGYYEPHINAWDCLAGLILVKEAGGWTNPFLADDGLTTGNPILVTANGLQHQLNALTSS